MDRPSGDRGDESDVGLSQGKEEAAKAQKEADDKAAEAAKAQKEADDKAAAAKQEAIGIDGKIGKQTRQALVDALEAQSKDGAANA